MQAAAELDLPFLPMEEDWFGADPFTPFAEARRQHPWLARWKHGYVITQYQAMRDFFREEHKMRTQFHTLVDLMGAQGTPWGRFQNSHMLTYAGAEHKRLRDVLAPAFTPRAANLQRPLMSRVIRETLDEWVPRGKFDFEEFASYFPVTVMCSLIGAGADRIQDLRSSMEAIGQSTAMDPAQLPALQQGTIMLDDFVQDVMAERRASPSQRNADDLLDVMLDAQDKGQLTEREVADILIFLFVAGYDTSKNVLTLTMYELLKRPEMYERCAQSLDYCQKLVEESLRFHGTANVARNLNEDVVYRDTLLEKDALLWFPLAAATRDSSAVDDPDTLRPERKQTVSHIAFGLGPHICLGQYIARAQIAEGLHQIARRIRNPRSPGPRGWRQFPGVWGIDGLPIEFDQADA